MAAAECAATYWLGEGGGHQGDRSGKHPRLRKFRRQARVTQRELADQMSAAGRKMLPSAICASETGHPLVTIGQVVQFARFSLAKPGRKMPSCTGPDAGLPKVGPRV